MCSFRQIHGFSGNSADLSPGAENGYWNRVAVTMPPRMLQRPIIR